MEILTLIEESSGHLGSGNAIFRWLKDCIGSRVRANRGDDIHSYDGHVVSKCFALKLICECIFMNCRKDAFMGTMQGLQKYLKRRADIEDPLKRIEGFSHQIEGILPAGGSVENQKSEVLVRLIECDTFVNKHLKDNYPEPIEGPIVSLHGAQKVVQAIERCNQLRIDLGTFKTRLPLFWLSKQSEMSTSVKDPTEKAMYIANNFGLEPQGGGSFLIPIMFDMSSVAPKTPTFFDSLPTPPNKYFIPDNRPDKWGTARRIPDLEPTALEAVNQEIPFLALECQLGQPLGPTIMSESPSLKDWRNLTDEIWVKLVAVDPELPAELAKL